MSDAHGNHGPPLGKDFSQNTGNAYQLGEHETPDNALRIPGSISISPELFEKLYLSPENRVAGDLRKTFGNPTPL